MSSDVVIRVENLTKKYTIRHQNGRGNSGDGLRHAISDAVSSPLRGMVKGYQRLVKGFSRKLDSAALSPQITHNSITNNLPSPLSPPNVSVSASQHFSSSSEDFYALRDVSFEVKRGEVLGIIGRNGAGKSTLLKILSRITEPSSGRVGVRGRVASLLEVGTGFHPELTGRENVFLNGAILGMSHAEVKRKFDEIVEFSGVEKFIDTPVKRYSSGMYVRLAFAVAAHLEPEILIVDEVLAVGDTEFQKKCLGKMDQVARSEERTVLFVSHNMTAIESLCSRTAYFSDGKLIAITSTAAAISLYAAANRSSAYNTNRHQNMSYIKTAWIQNSCQMIEAPKIVTLRADNSFSVVVEIRAVACSELQLTTSFYDSLRRPLWTSSNYIFDKSKRPVEDDLRITLTYFLPRLSTSELIVDLAVGEANLFPYHDLVMDAIVCAVSHDDEGGNRTYRTEFPLALSPKCDVVHQPSSCN